MSEFREVVKILFIAVWYGILIYLRLALLYIYVRLKLWSMRRLSVLRFSIALKRRGLPKDLVNEVIELYRQTIERTIVVPHISEFMNFRKLFTKH